MANMGRNEGNSFTSSRSTQQIRNPYDNRKCNSQQSDNYSSFSPASEASMRMPPLQKFGDFHTSLTAFYNLSTGASGDANTSFSIASYTIKRQKLLHRVTFELKNLVNWDVETRNGTCLGIDATTLLMRGATGACIVAIPPSMHVLVYSVLNVVNSMLLEEVFESKCTITSTTSTGNGNTPGTENETVIAALEFLSTAYGCLECDIIFASLKEVIDCQAIGIDNDDGSSGEMTREWTIIDALFHFILFEHISTTRSLDRNELDNNLFGNDNDIYFEEEQSSNLGGRKSFGNSRTQLLALTALTKAMLNAEYIQRYCSSLTLPPDQGIDTLLGEGMGLRMDERTTDLERIVKDIVSFLTRENNINSNDDREKSTLYDGDVRYREILPELTSLSFLGVLLRTNCTERIHHNTVIMMTERLQNKLLSKSSQIHHSVNQIEEKSDAFLDSILCLGLVLCMKRVAPGCIRDDVSEIGSRTLLNLTSMIFSTPSSGTGFSQEDVSKTNTSLIGGYIHIVACLASFRSEVLVSFLKEHVVKDMTKRIIMNFLQDIPDQCVWKPQGDMFLMVQFIMTSNHQYRKVISQILNDENGVQSRNSNLEHAIKSHCKLMRQLITLWSNDSFSTSVGSIVFFRVLIGHGKCISDDLESNLRRVTEEKGVLERFAKAVKCCLPEETTNIWEDTKYCALIDMLNDLCAAKYNCVPIFESMLQTHQETVNRLLFTLQMPGTGWVVCASKLGLASFLMHCYMSIKGSDRKGISFPISLHQGLRKFIIENVTTQETRQMKRRNPMGIFDEAFSQTASRDLIQRALNLQAVSSSTSFHEIGNINMAGTIFSNIRLHTSRSSQMKSIIVEHENNAKKLENEARKLTAEKEQLLNKHLNREIYFERERTQLNLEKRAEVMALADIRFEEKLEAEKKFSVCDGKLIEAEKEIVKIEAVSESQKALICQLQCENNENTCKISEMNSRIKVMQINFDGKSLADSKRIDELNCHLTQVRECLNVAEEKNSSWNEKHSRLFDDHREAETLLEDVMFKLISFADLYSTMENKFEREKTILSENLLSSERALDETQKKYQSSEKKADSYKEKNQELKQAYDKLKRKSKTINSDKTRKPMGTLAFMNSLQDNSISSVRRTKSTNKERQMQPKENEYVPNSERRSALRTNDTRRNFRIKKR